MLSHQVIHLPKADNDKTRLLWEEVFWEDSKAFVDYYYMHKIQENEVYVCKENDEILSMLHLTPYQLKTRENEVFDSYYIVGVTTKEAYRHQKRMQAMLITAILDCNQKEIPFVFLMPANPLIYEPYEFRYIYQRTEYVWEKDLNIEESIKNIRVIPKKEYAALVKWVNSYLEKEADFFCMRSEAYYEKLSEELKSQNGHILGIYDAEHRLTGQLLYAKENKVYIQECLCKPEETPLDIKEKSEKKPVIMGRITNVAAFLQLFHLKSTDTNPVTVLIFGVRDKDITKNSGVYEWHISKKESKVLKREDAVTEKASLKKAIPCFEISELTELFFGMKKCHEIKNGELFEAVETWQNGCINEIV